MAGRADRVNLGNNLVGVGAAGCLERSGVSNNLDRGAAMSSNVGPCRESNNSNRGGEGDNRVERASVDRDRMAGLDRCLFIPRKKRNFSDPFFNQGAQQIAQ